VPTGPLLIVEVAGGDQFRRLAIRMKQAGRRDLLRELRKELRDAGRPTVAAVQGAYRTLPDISPAHRAGAQARTTVAKAVRVELRSSATAARVRVLVDAKRLPEDMRALPKVWEAGRWRHPVFASGDQTRSQWRWVEQQSHPAAVFRRTCASHAPDFRAACLRAMDQIKFRLS
jgi:hypothetical protein